MLGISGCFKDYDEQYIRKAPKAAAKYVFTSLQIPEEDYSNCCPDFQKFVGKPGFRECQMFRLLLLKKQVLLQATLMS